MTSTIAAGPLPELVLPPVTRTTLALFAGASGDHNPIHIDIDAARAAGFEDVFAHGMLSLAYLGRMLTGWVPQERIRSLSVRFTAITPVHAEVHCTGEVVRIEATDEGHLAHLTVQAALADGTVTLSGTAVVRA